MPTHRVKRRHTEPSPGFPKGLYGVPADCTLVEPREKTAMGKYMGQPASGLWQILDRVQKGSSLRAFCSYCGALLSPTPVGAMLDHVECCTEMADKIGEMPRFGVLVNEARARKKRNEKKKKAKKREDDLNNRKLETIMKILRGEEVAEGTKENPALQLEVDTRAAQLVVGEGLSYKAFNGDYIQRCSKTVMVADGSKYTPLTPERFQAELLPKMYNQMKVDLTKFRWCSVAVNCWWSPAEFFYGFTIFADGQEYLYDVRQWDLTPDEEWVKAIIDRIHSENPDLLITGMVTDGCWDVTKACGKVLSETEFGETSWGVIQGLNTLVAVILEVGDFKKVWEAAEGSSFEWLETAKNFVGRLHRAKFSETDSPDMVKELQSRASEMVKIFTPIVDACTQLQSVQLRLSDCFVSLLKLVCDVISAVKDSSFAGDLNGVAKEVDFFVSQFLTRPLVLLTAFMDLRYSIPFTEGALQKIREEVEEISLRYPEEEKDMLTHQFESFVEKKNSLPPDFYDSENGYEDLSLVRQLGLRLFSIVPLTLSPHRRAIVGALIDRLWHGQSKVERMICCAHLYMKEHDPESAKDPPIFEDMLEFKPNVTYKMQFHCFEDEDDEEEEFVNERAGLSVLCRPLLRLAYNVSCMENLPESFRREVEGSD